MKTLLIIILSLMTFNEALGAMNCKKVRTGSGDRLVTQTVCWWEFSDTTGYTQQQLIMEDVYRTSLPTYEKAQQNITEAKSEYATCLGNADLLYPSCAIERTDKLYAEYIACATIAAYLPKLQSIAAGALCTKAYEYDNQKTGSYCSGVVEKEKDNCSFNPT